jgi:hypothetical protein
MITVDEAVGDPDTGYFFTTPDRPLRKWPVWSLRFHLEPYPNMCRAFDLGTLYSSVEERASESLDFFSSTHKAVGPGVMVLQVEQDGIAFYPSVLSLLFQQGHVSRWLDSLDQQARIVFPEVIDLKFAQMLHRRGFELIAIAEDDAHPDDWLPCHVRGFADQEIE